MKKFISLLFAAGLILLSQTAYALIINFNYDDTDPFFNAATRNVIEDAAMSWISGLNDNVTVNIDIQSQAFGNTQVNAATTHNNPLTDPGPTPFDTIRNVMVADEGAEGAVNTIVNSLPAWSQFNADLPPTSRHPGWSWTVLEEISGTSANLKALGYMFDPNFVDGTIKINRDAGKTWDLDRTDGVPVGSYDLHTAVAHEIGHVLGYQSMIDEWGTFWNIDKTEKWSADNSGATPLFTVTSPSILDLFRFGNADLPTTLAEFTSKDRNLNLWLSDIISAWLILDPSLTPYQMEAGFWVNQGSSPTSYQASHWINSLVEIGLMDPTMTAATFYNQTIADWMAMDVIGWEYLAQLDGTGEVLWNGNGTSIPQVPEPATMLLLGTGLVGVAGAARKRKKDQA